MKGVLTVFLERFCKIFKKVFVVVVFFFFVSRPIRVPTTFGFPRDTESRSSSSRNRNVHYDDNSDKERRRGPSRGWGGLYESLWEDPND